MVGFYLTILHPQRVAARVLGAPTTSGGAIIIRCGKTGGRECDFAPRRGQNRAARGLEPLTTSGLRVFSTEDPEHPEPCFAQYPEHDRQVPVDGFTFDRGKLHIFYIRRVKSCREGPSPESGVGAPRQGVREGCLKFAIAQKYGEPPTSSADASFHWLSFTA